MAQNVSTLKQSTAEARRGYTVAVPLILMKRPSVQQKEKVPAINAQKSTPTSHEAASKHLPLRGLELATKSRPRDAKRAASEQHASSRKEYPRNEKRTVSQPGAMSEPAAAGGSKISERSKAGDKETLPDKHDENDTAPEISTAAAEQEPAPTAAVEKEPALASGYKVYTAEYVTALKEEVLALRAQTQHGVDQLERSEARLKTLSDSCLVWAETYSGFDRRLAKQGQEIDSLKEALRAEQERHAVTRARYDETEQLAQSLFERLHYEHQGPFAQSRW
ncbi:uncharacterized protein B0I36DRAFT_369277 [Microdochium trichocladiopsis]|uniref:Uncharacterized protein n=1 Tax=Microdochium trichocladiopsis TaxID=1682393 RepID=A0A9P8XS88_9PEZI|nr:uncharacterized protein B0I36DRAFT_369277 [Microdochium trichocladiopsis]KAH7014306.1 hypothetical protein B0I36DRAFT_369277 [Microdochium trichocladiopsis]